ncbi:multidrug efflux MFS transporter [Salipaludibacillus sp. LMS25]|jgi:EmrB/QacA subfamily drug resistance transporter|uniref:MDR family MFS transporter n=1 Tax=Salipaludibacillus sp. LMS25 TaxID=2924031 RepID=UPI0020D12A2D|nr:MDR family MFS transporter [Salipaludibacillus sp. LMS25]UTR13441.1 multidrug efflux MFS transporter [Salipaludibacillus sp. LMS25]
MAKIPQKWLVVITVLLGTFTIILNNSMLNPAVPHLMTVFDADAVATGWVITIFMVAMGMIMPLTGFLGDKFGKKQLYMAGLTLFLLGSLLGSLSWNLPSLIAFRGLQGIGGGVMMPLSLALIFDVFPRNERGLATGVWGVAAMMAPTIGPTLGGILVELGSWQWLFLCNIPTGLLGLIFSYIYLRQSEKMEGMRFDKWGFITVTLGVGSILLALGRVSKLANLTEPLNIFLVAIGSLAIFCFVKIENRTEQPLLDLSIMRVPAYAYSVWVAMISSISLFGGIFLLPLLIQQVYGYGAVMTGVVFLPAALLTGVFMTIGGKLLDQHGPTWVVTPGLCIVAIGTALLGFIGMETAIWVIFLLNGVRGIGMGLSTMPATTAGINAIPDKFVSRGSAMNNVMRQMSSALGIVFVSIYFEVRRGQVTALNGGSIEEASLTAITEGFLIVAVLAVLSIPAGFLLGKEVTKQRKKELAETAE